jgi:hypothetical protein
VKVRNIKGTLVNLWNNEINGGSLKDISSIINILKYRKEEMDLKFLIGE